MDWWCYGDTFKPKFTNKMLFWYLNLLVLIFHPRISPCHPHSRSFSAFYKLRIDIRNTNPGTSARKFVCKMQYWCISTNNTQNSYQQHGQKPWLLEEGGPLPPPTHKQWMCYSVHFHVTPPTISKSASVPFPHTTHPIPIPTHQKEKLSIYSGSTLTRSSLPPD